MVLGFQDGVPRGKWQSFLLVSEENAWGGKASVEARGWSALIGQPCGFWVIRKVVGELSQVKTLGFMVFVSVSPFPIAHSRSFLNVYWRKWMNEFLTWNVFISAQRLWHSLRHFSLPTQARDFAVYLLRGHSVWAYLKGTDTWKNMVKILNP